MWMRERESKYTKTQLSDVKFDLMRSSTLSIPSYIKCSPSYVKYYKSLQASNVTSSFPIPSYIRCKPISS